MRGPVCLFCNCRKPSAVAAIMAPGCRQRDAMREGMCGIDDSELAVRAGEPSPGLRSVLLVGLADMVLGIELQPELGHQTELGLEEVDVFFLVVHQLLE